jgi:thiamine-monophosphate kinase
LSSSHGESLGPGPEFDLIRRFLQHAAPAPPEVTLGPGDDCALVSAPQLALSSDMSVEGVHFQRDWLTPHEIGYRAAAAALSDLAAMAARPIGLLASLALPDADRGETAVALMAGVTEAAARLGAGVLGGDVTGSLGALALDVTVVGAADAPILRNGARAGDEVWVTGELGGADTALAAWLRGDVPDARARERFARPAPRTREALWLAAHVRPTALIDLSDGLAGDAAHIGAASGVAIVFDLSAIPVFTEGGAGAADTETALRRALSGGEDYELCFTAPPGRVQPLAAAFEAEFGVRLSRVAEAEPGAGVWHRGAGGRQPLRLRGFQHFGGE